MNFLTNKMNWPSEHTRGYQIASALGCRVNAKITDLSETTINVKCYPHLDLECNSKMNNLYLDLIDSDNTIDVANAIPNAKIIAITDIMKDYLSCHIKNDIVVIPEHTCNFDNEVREDREVKVVGYVGSTQCFDLDVFEVKEALNSIGLDFRFLTSETMDVTREDICEFYKSIDIQLAFRLPNIAVRKPIYRNPLKIFNAGSFKIPTVAFPEISYEICAGTYFLEALNLASVIDKCYMLKNDDSLYDFYSNRVYEWSKQFDIVKVANLYAKLSPNEKFDIEENVNKLKKTG